MKIIAISGSTGSGKDSVIEEILKEVNQLYPGRVSYEPYYKTRKPRANEKHADYCISEEEMQSKIDSGEVPTWSSLKIGDYRVGLSTLHLNKSEFVVVNVSDGIARKLKEVISEQAGRCLTVFLHSPPEVRKTRYMLRESWLFEEPAQYRINNDVTDPNPENHSDFDLVVENKEGQLAETLKEIMPKIKEFIES